MKKNIELRNLVKKHVDSDFEDHVGSILLLLKELSRRMEVWIKKIEEKEIPLGLGPQILFDVAFKITGNKTDISTELKLFKKEYNFTLSHYDELMLSSHFNWIKNEASIKKLGFLNANPYSPYIEIFNRGGHHLKFNYRLIEVFPFIVVSLPSYEELRNNDLCYIELDERSLNIADKQYFDKQLKQKKARGKGDTYLL